MEMKRGGGSRTAAAGPVLLLAGPLSNLPGVIGTTGGQVKISIIPPSSAIVKGLLRTMLSLHHLILIKFAAETMELLFVTFVYNIGMGLNFASLGATLTRSHLRAF